MSFPPLLQPKSSSSLGSVLRLAVAGVLGVAVGVVLFLIFWPLIIVVGLLLFYANWRFRRALRKAGEQFAAGLDEAPSRQDSPGPSPAPGASRRPGAKRVEVKITHIQSPPPQKPG
jgi:hypothetical protein